MFCDRVVFLRVVAAVAASARSDGAMAIPPDVVFQLRPNQPSVTAKVACVRALHP